MTEAGYVELPIIQWLSGEGSAAPGDAGLGWQYKDEAAMAAYDRPLEDPLVEKLLVEAIIIITKRLRPRRSAVCRERLRKAMAPRTSSRPTGRR